MVRSVYVIIRCTDPGWDGTVTERNPYIFSTRLFIFCKRAIFIFNLCTYFFKATFSTIRAVTEIEIGNVNKHA